MNIYIYKGHLKNKNKSFYKCLALLITIAISSKAYKKKNLLTLK